MKRETHLVRENKKSGRKFYFVKEYRKSKPKKVEFLDNLYLLFQTVGLILIGFGSIYPILFFNFNNWNPHQTVIVVFSFIIGIIIIIASIIFFKHKKAISWTT